MTLKTVIKGCAVAAASIVGVISLILFLGGGGIKESRADYQPPLLASEYADEYRNTAGTTEKMLTPKGIYGTDNRIDAYAALETARKLAQSSVAFFRAEELVEEGDAYVLKETASLQEKGVCANERFVKQPLAGFCSGFLVAEDVVITAGHCLNPLKIPVPRSEVRLVFGFAMHNRDKANIRFAKQDVYRIGAVLEHFNDLKSDDDPSKKDWGTIKLDRPASGHIPVDVRQGDTPIDEEVTMIGYPLGLPVKITDGGRIMENNGNFLRTNLDAFGGNSGSAVFSTASIKSGTPLVEGILVSGEPDFIEEPNASCARIHHFNNGKAGERLTKIGLVIQFDDSPPPQSAPVSDGVDICKVVPELCRQQ